MNVEIGTKTAKIPEKEFINGIFIAVYQYVLTWPLASTMYR